MSRLTQHNTTPQIAHPMTQPAFQKHQQRTGAGGGGAGGGGGGSSSSSSSGYWGSVKGAERGRGGGGAQGGSHGGPGAGGGRGSALLEVRCLLALLVGKVVEKYKC
jgi:hypothetical protein